MSSACNNELLQRTFVPTGLHLMQGKDIVSSILREQQQYIESTIGIPITGILPHAMNAQFTNTENTVKEKIEAFDEVQSVERTSDTDHYGRWLVVSSAINREVVLNKLNKSLALLYKAQHDQKRIITAGTREIQTEQMGHTTVGTYAEILSRNYASKQPIPTALKEKAKYSGLPTKNRADRTHLTSSRKTDRPPDRIPTTESLQLSQDFTALANRLQSLESKQEEQAKKPNTQQYEQ